MTPLHDVSVSTEKATFCMGCYWAPECTFGVLAGVIRTRVGHAGAAETAPRQGSRAEYVLSLSCRGLGTNGTSPNPRAANRVQVT